MRGFEDDGAEVNQYHELLKQDFMALLKGRQLQDPKRLQNLQRIAKIAAKIAPLLPGPTGALPDDKGSGSVSDDRGSGSVSALRVLSTVASSYIVSHHPT
jgi:hypothetical protein